MEEGSIEQLPDPLIEIHLKLLEQNQILCEMLLLVEENCVTSVEFGEFIEPYKELINDPALRIISDLLQGNPRAITGPIDVLSEATNNELKAYQARFTSISERFTPLQPKLILVQENIVQLLENLTK